MIPKFRSSVFVGAAFALMLPYFAFVIYFSLRLPRNYWPDWFINTILIWFDANFFAVMLLARRMFHRRGTAGSQSASQPTARAKPAVWIVRIVGSYLVIVWSVLFLNGVKGTIQGRLALSRAVPAGAFLLIFIWAFGWSVYRTFQRKV